VGGPEKENFERILDTPNSNTNRRREEITTTTSHHHHRPLSPDRPRATPKKRP